MWHWVSQVDEERLVLISLNKIDRTVGKICSKSCLVVGRNCRVRDVLVLEKGQVGIRACRVQGPHVVGVRDTVKLIEPVIGGQELSLYSKVPFAVSRGGISFLFKDFGNGLLLV